MGFYQPFDSRFRRLWCHGPKPEYALDEDWADQWYIAARTMTLVRPGQDLIVLPGGNARTRAFWQFCCRVLGLHSDQAVWTSGHSYLLDDDIRSELLPQLRVRMQEGEWELVPYSVTPPFQQWASDLPARVFGDPEEWVRIHSNKAILHPNALSARRVPELPLLAEHVPEARVPRGFACTDQEELLTAFDLLSEQGVQTMILKPVHGTTGEGIQAVSSCEQLHGYTWPMGAVILEELLHVDHDQFGQIMAPSVQYIGLQLFDCVSDQGFQGMAYEGNMTPSLTCAAFQERLMLQARQLLEWLRPNGPGGFDFLSVANQPVLIDPNIGRFTGAHPARIFRALHAPHAHFICWKVSPQRDVEQLWESLMRSNLAFLPGTNRPGVFPLCWLPGMWGMLIAVGMGRDQTVRLREQAQECYLA